MASAPPASLRAVWSTRCGLFNIELHKLHCVVEPSGGGFAELLLNPANGRLSGINYPTFRRGSDDEKDTMPGNWCVDHTAVERQTSADVFIGATSCVDGLVHLLGGPSLKDALAGRRCSVGEVVHTESFGSLRGSYPKGVLHTNAPAVTNPDSARLLRQCYEAALGEAFVELRAASLASVLLGTGVRGIGADVGARCAMLGACRFWERRHGEVLGGKALRFAIRDDSRLQQVATSFQEVKSAALRREF
uniref:Macro domain-containing protein n=1 Tax=Pyrodinium bahamense TaxID=73915 RepID=A0A7S0AKB8_9DINO